MLTHHSTELTDPGVVPSLADRWSHHTGETNLKMVPCHWRATRYPNRAQEPGQPGQGELRIESICIRGWASAESSGRGQGNVG